MAFSLGFVAICFALAAIALLPLVKFIRLWFTINKFQGPPAIPLLGNAHQLKQDPFELIQQVIIWVETYRTKGKGIMRLWLGPVPALFLYEPNAVEQILSSSKHITKGFVYSFVEPWLGLGLLTSTGEKWFHRRKMLTPTFHFAILQNFVDVFNEQSVILANKLDQLKDKPTVDIFPLITLCVLDIISETAMGKKMNAQDQCNNEYVNAVMKMVDVIQERQKKPWYWPDLVFNLTKCGKEHTRCLKILHGMTNSIIEERSKEPPKQLETGNGIRKTRIAFLDLLLKMHREDPSFTIKDIREEVDTFMFEGHDTTAALAGWAIFLIGHHDKIQQKLHEEVDEIFGDSDRPVTSDDLQKLTYLTCVLKEALRIFPSVPVIGRDLLEDCYIDGKLVPKGTLMIISINPLHRDAEQFPKPHIFDPDRFLPENVANRHPFAYVPFSAGPRNCIGQKFAMMEDKILIATLLRRFSFKSTQDLLQTMPLGELIMRPSDGLRMKITRRK